MRTAMHCCTPCLRPHAVSFAPWTEKARRRRIAIMHANPAPISARTPATMRLVASRECDAPPNPVCAPPEGMALSAAAVVGEPLDSPAPGEPDPPVAPTPPVAVALEPDALVPDPPLPDGVVVVVATGAMKLFASVAVQVTALPPPVAVPLHWLTVTGSADVPAVTVQSTVVSTVVRTSAGSGAVALGDCGIGRTAAWGARLGAAPARGRSDALVNRGDRGRCSKWNVVGDCDIAVHVASTARHDAVALVH